MRAVRDARSAELLERLRAICLALPEAQEKISHGEPTWFAGDVETAREFEEFDARPFLQARDARGFRPCFASRRLRGAALFRRTCHDSNLRC